MCKIKIIKNLLFLVLTLSVLSGCKNAAEGRIQLIVNGESAYSIILPSNASAEETRAAEFLRDHLLKISGCELPVVYSDAENFEKGIFISKSAVIADGGGFAVFSKGESLFIHGGNERGCIYGVSELLEKFLNVRYYSPRAVVIPRRDNIILPRMDIRDSPVNTYRNVNGDFVKDADYKDFHRLHDIDDMFAPGYFVHTFHRLLPWQEYFRTHPEYFAYMNGKRIIDQLCLSHPEVLERVIEKLGKEMALQPGKQVWSVSQDDNFSYCQCGLCSAVIEKEESPAGPIIRFVNRVAEAFPDKIISTLAYQYSRRAPVKTRPRENVQIMLCTIELGRSRSIEDEPASASFIKDLEDWGRISSRIFLWDYTVNFAHSISPFPNLHTLKPNIQLFAANNVKEHFQQTNTGTGHEFSELKNYVLAKLLWNPDADTGRIIHEFTDGYYGRAAPWIRKTIRHMQNEILKTGEWLDIYGPPNNHQHTFLSDKNIKKLQYYFDRAEKLAKDNPAYHLHVRTARMPVQYAVMEIGKSELFGARGWYDETNGSFAPRSRMKEILESFYQTSILADAAPVNESGLTAEAYYHSTLRFVDVQVHGNYAFRKTVAADPLPAEKYSSGDLALLTNGVRGANDFKVHWLGWEAQNFTLVLDLEKATAASRIEISTLYDPKSWILHPRSVTCLVSDDGTDYTLLEKQTVIGDQRAEEVNRLFVFAAPKEAFRYVKFEVKGTLRLFDWHPSAGGGSWVFVDEIVVR